jgi:hypothetical protein
MLYKKFIKADEGFQYSINIQYDLNKLDKIKGYIPTSSSVDILRNFLSSFFYDSKERSNILIGPYGKGKSHLLLILLALISLDKDIEEINILIEKIGKIEVPIKEMINEIRKDNKKILPIIINSNYYDLNQAFLIGLKDALDREELNDLKPNTYFDTILETVTMWQNDYPETFKLFINKLGEQDISIKEFISKVKNYDEKVYIVFKNIHPQIASGIEFNPLINADIIKLYEEINYKLCETKNYNGMFIVFDEFSKFLEASISRNNSRDIKLIQDFAEVANRSGKNQIHFTCITHKGINDYITNLPKEKIDAWRAVEGRFREIYFTSSSNQNYELISNTIIKDEKTYKKFKLNNTEQMSFVNDEIARTSLFKDIDNYNSLIGDGCFPLHPISSFSLPRVSELVAQNERTLFTFLSKDEQGSLMNFVRLNKGEFQYLTVDWIYDYFEILFKKEIYNRRIHSVWLKADNAIKKVENIYEIKIIKALAVFYVINEFDKLIPSDTFIKFSLGFNEESYDKAIKSLINNHIIIKNDSTGYYRFSLGSELDVIHKISEKKNLLNININIKNEIEKIIDLGYEIPKRYNDEFQMIRFFKKTFITTNELLNINHGNDLIKHYNSDGIILYLIYFSELEKEQVLTKIKELNNKRILVCIPNNIFEKEDDIKKYLAIQMLKSDPTFVKYELAKQELEIIEEDIILDLKNYIRINYSIKNKKGKFYDENGRNLEINREYYLNRKISEICFEVFNRTIKVNNELINKTVITSQILSARNKIIQYILDSEENINKFPIETRGPEVTLFKATIENKDLLVSRTGNDENLAAILAEIEQFIFQSEENKNCFITLYTRLYNAEYGYGVRSGIIPIYLAYVIRQHIKNIIIYYMGKEIPLSVETINKVNENPEKYYLLLETGSNEKNEYINKLEGLFVKYKSNKVSRYNRYNSLVEAMQNWMYSLPKFARECELIYDNKVKDKNREIINLRKELLRFDINPRELLFERLNNKVFKTTSLNKCYKKVEKTKDELDKFISKMKQELIYKTKNIFDKGYKGELGNALENWYNELPSQNKIHLYDSTSNSLLNFISTLSTNNEDIIIEKLSKLVTGLNIEDWNDRLVDTFLEDITNIKSEISNEISETAGEKNNFYEISLVLDGNKKTKFFDSCEISSIGTTLYNNIENAFDEYGGAIDDNEKRSILMKFLQKYM